MKKVCPEPFPMTSLCDATSYIYIKKWTQKS